jgi:ribosomal-protein-alanine N-acetyltransferase
MRDDRDDTDADADTATDGDGDSPDDGTGDGDDSAGDAGPDQRSVTPVRPARPEDAPAVCALQTLLPAPSPALLSRAIGGLGASPDPVASPHPTALLVSPTDGGRPAGYLLALCGATETHVAELVVAPDHRRQGRARALVSELRSRLRARADREEGPTIDTGPDAGGESYRLTLLVAPSNEPAVSLYRSLGFVVETRLPEHFAGDPALRMTRRV